MNEFTKSYSHIKVGLPEALMIGAAFLFLLFPFFDGVEFMVRRWAGKEEYSHGFFLPLVVLYLLWERREVLVRQRYPGSYWGAVLTFGGLILCLIGELATIFEAIQYGFVMAIWGIVLSITGLKTFRYYFIPLVILLFMIPLPNFIYHNLSSQLQLLSSKIGVEIINLFEIPVYLEGNVIDLGQLQLQVVEACSGLRYLFPLMTLGFILGYMFSGPLLFRAFIFLSSIPITILMNSFRIGLIGVTVEYWGKQAAEGILHDFEGWAVFMSSLSILVLEIWLMARLMGDRRSIADLLDPMGNIQSSDTKQDKTPVEKRLSVTPSFYSAVGVMLLMTIVTITVPQREDVVPERESFATFPVLLSDWQGQREYMQPIYLNSLKLTDYLLTNYTSPVSGRVNFYIAYYNTQKKGRSAHSPKSCIPGDGWEISEFDQRNIVLSDSTSVPVNRAVISKGPQRSLVYYWFQQRGRIITNEYLVKWYLLVDALFMGRTDGAMIRITTNVSRFESLEKADERLRKLMVAANPHLDRYVPN